MTDKADGTSFRTGFHRHDNAVTGLVDRHGALPCFRISVPPFGNFLRIVAKASGSENDRFAGNVISVALVVFSDNANDFVVFLNQIDGRCGKHGLHTEFIGGIFHALDKTGTVVNTFVVLNDVPGVVLERCFANDFKLNAVLGEPFDVFSGSFNEILVFIRVYEVVLAFDELTIGFLTCERIASKTVPFGIHGKKAFGVLGIAADIRILFKQNHFFTEFSALNSG